MWKPYNKNFNSAAYAVDSSSKAKIWLPFVDQLRLLIPITLVILCSGLSKKARQIPSLVASVRCRVNSFQV